VRTGSASRRRRRRSTARWLRERSNGRRPSECQVRKPAGVFESGEDVVIRFEGRAGVTSGGSRVRVGRCGRIRRTAMPCAREPPHSLRDRHEPRFVGFLAQRQRQCPTERTACQSAHEKGKGRAGDSWPRERARRAELSRSTRRVVRLISHEKTSLRIHLDKTASRAPNLPPRSPRWSSIPDRECERSAADARPAARSRIAAMDRREPSNRSWWRGEG